MARKISPELFPPGEPPLPTPIEILFEICLNDNADNGASVAMIAIIEPFS